MSSQLQVTGEAKIRDIQGPVVANSGVVTALDGAASQYVRGDGTLADFPTSSGGGSSVSYYLNSSVSQGTIGGVAYRELSKDPIIGAGTDIAISSNGYVANYITDVNDPDVTIVAGGNFNCEFYFSVNNDTGNPFTYAELYKYDGTTFTLLGTSVGVPEYINQGTIIAPYYFAIPVPTSALALTDRLAIRIYVNVDGRTVTLHTENGHLCQVVTTLSKGMVSLNNLTDQSQFITTGTSGTDFNIVSSGDTHTFNIPSASDTNRGLVTTGTQTFAGIKIFNIAIKGEQGILLKNGITSSSNGYTALNGFDNTLAITSSISGTPYSNYLEFTPATSNTYTFPNASGTLALTSNLSSYVPYTGATASVDLGTNTLTALGVIANSFSAIGNINPSGNGGYIFLKQGIAPFTYDTGYNSITANSTRFVLIANVDASNNKSALLELGSLTNNTSRTFTLPDLSGTLALLEGSQTFTGAKTFTDNTIFSDSPLFDQSANYKVGASLVGTGNYISMAFDKSGTGSSSILSMKLADGTTAKAINLDFLGSPATYTYTFPASSGTIALTSNLSAYLPLTGGTLSGSLSASTYYSSAGIFLSTSGQATSGSGYATINGGTNYLDFRPANGGIFLFQFPYNTTRTFTLPDATGTIALTSNLSAYLPLAGGTLTGALSGTSATFSGIVSSIVSSGSTSFRVINADNSRTWSLIPSTNAAESDLWLYYGGTGAGTKVAFVNNGNVLIGSTTDNGSRLQVTGAATFSSSVGINGGSTNFPLVVKVATNQNLRVSTETFTSVQAINDAVSAFVTLKVDGLPLLLNSQSGGNVGIGTSSPSAYSHGGTNLVAEITNSATSANAQAHYIISTGATANTGSIGTITWALPNSSAADKRGSLIASNIESNSSSAVYTNLTFATNAGGSPSERMRITSGGNVGIGTSSPNVSSQGANNTLMTIQGQSGSYGMLEIGATTNTAESLIGVLGFTSTNVTGGLIGFISMAAEGTTGSNVGGRIQFSTKSNGGGITERMRITSGGYLKASNNGSYNSATGPFHEMRTSEGSNAIVELTNSASSNPYGISLYFSGADPNNATNYVFGAYSSFSSTWMYRIFSNGTVAARSDIRLKKNIEPTRNGYLKDLCKLEVVKYNWYNNEDNTPKEIGLIAQQVETIFPNLVITDKVIKTREIQQEDGTIIEEKYEDGDTKSIKHSVLPFMLLKGLQEANTKIENLQSQIDELKALINK